MSNSTLFKAAHALTKATIQTGDSYSATFAICLKVVYAESKKSNIAELVEKRDVLAILQNAEYIADVQAELKSDESIDFDMFIDAYKNIDIAFINKFSKGFINAICAYDNNRDFCYNSKLAYDGMMTLALNLFDQELWDL